MGERLPILAYIAHGTFETVQVPVHYDNHATCTITFTDWPPVSLR